MRHKMPIGMLIMYAHIARIYAYGVGYGVVCSDVKAMLEPRNAEQQDCSSAFYLCIYGELFKITE